MVQAKNKGYTETPQVNPYGAVVIGLNRVTPPNEVGKPNQQRI